MKKRSGINLIWSLILIPLVVALSGGGMSLPTDAASLLQLLGKLTGVMGLVLLLCAAALSARVPGFDIHFGGLTNLWKIHHLMAAACFFLLLLHPLLLAFSRASLSIAAAADVLAPAADDWLVWSGWLALILLMIFLAPTFKFFGEPDYARWKQLHRLASITVVLALVHGIGLRSLLTGYVGNSVWVVLAGLAITAMLYRFLISKWRGLLEYRVETVLPCANNVVELTLTPCAESLSYKTGQLVYLTPHDESLQSGRDEEHPYTLSSAPQETNLRIAIKALGDATQALQSVEPGTMVSIEGPYGDFFPAEIAAGPQLWIAGGIGISPFLARARELAATSQSAEVCLIYCVQDESRAIFLEELQALATKIDGMNLVMHYFYEAGPLSGQFVQAHCNCMNSCNVFVCGPPALTQIAKSILKTSGLPNSRLSTEEFNLL